MRVPGFAEAGDFESSRLRLRLGASRVDTPTLNAEAGAVGSHLYKHQFAELYGEPKVSGI